MNFNSERRNFFGALWHGAFLALGMALTQPTTVIAAFVSDLTGSTIWVGGLSTVLTVAGALPQLLVARLVEPRPRKMPFLMLAIYLRVVSWGMLAGLIYLIGASHPAYADSYVGSKAQPGRSCHRLRYFRANNTIAGNNFRVNPAGYQYFI